MSSNSVKYNYHIVVADDNTALLQTMKVVLSSKFTKVATVSNPQLIQGIMGLGNVDVVLLDMNFSAKKLDGSEGLFWLKRIKEHETPPIVIMITAFGEIDLAVECMKCGADDFITKPWNNDELVVKIVSSIEKRQQKQSQAEPSSNATLAMIEKERIADTLQKVGRNMTKAAELLGISRRTLYNKIEKYGL